MDSLGIIAIILAVFLIIIIFDLEVLIVLRLILISLLIILILVLVVTHHLGKTSLGVLSIRLRVALLSGINGLLLVIFVVLIAHFGKVGNRTVSEVGVEAHSSTAGLLDSLAPGSGLFDALLGVSLSLLGVDTVSLLTSLSLLQVGVPTADLLHGDGSSIQIASSEGRSVASSSDIVGELGDSAGLLGRSFLDDSLVRVLSEIPSWLSNPVGLGESGWLVVVL